MVFLIIDLFMHINLYNNDNLLNFFILVFTSFTSQTLYLQKRKEFFGYLHSFTNKQQLK